MWNGAGCSPSGSSLSLPGRWAVWVLFQILAVYPVVQLPADQPGRVAEDGSGAGAAVPLWHCGPCAPVEDLEEAAGSRACPGPATAGPGGGIRGSEPTDARMFAVSPCLFLCASKQTGQREAGGREGGRKRQKAAEPPGRELAVCCALALDCFCQPMQTPRACVELPSRDSCATSQKSVCERESLCGCAASLFGAGEPS